MTRFAILAVAATLFGLAPAVARAGSPHFVNNAFTESCTADTITVTGKEAGLGDETQIHVVLNAVAECINPGDHHPKAENKEGIAAEADEPVQNGKADIDLTADADISPSCSPPMTIIFTDVSITDSTNELTKSLPNCYP